MNKRSCALEAKTVGATRNGGDIGRDAEHLKECEVCRDAAAVTNWLAEVARATERTTPVPAAEAIWWRAQVVRSLCDQDDRVDRRTRPLVLVQMVAVFLTLATTVGFLLTSDSVLPGFTESLGSLLGGASAALIAVAAALSLLTGGLVAWQVARELT